LIKLMINKNSDL